MGGIFRNGFTEKKGGRGGGRQGGREGGVVRFERDNQMPDEVMLRSVTAPLQLSGEKFLL